jgi:rhomboid protease GluP
MVHEDQAAARVPFWRRLAPVTVLLMLLCVLWTLQIPTHSLWLNEFGRLVTAIILHGGWVHLIINVISLYFVGSVLERGVGRGSYLFFLVASAEAGVAASLLWNTDVGWRMGISGGIAGLIGLVLALEWSVTRSVKEFIKQRNTILVLALLVINVGISYYIGTIQGAKIDNAGHLGGFLCGLLGGLVYYRRHALHPVRGVVLTLLLVVPPLAYAARPFRNPEYYRFRMAQAHKNNDKDAEMAAIERLLRLSPGDIGASVRLSQLLDSAEPLEGLEPSRASDANRVVAAWLTVALHRLQANPEEARALAERAADISHAASPAWMPFGRSRNAPRTSPTPHPPRGCLSAPRRKHSENSSSRTTRSARGTTP